MEKNGKLSCASLSQFPSWKFSNSVPPDWSEKFGQDFPWTQSSSKWQLLGWCRMATSHRLLLTAKDILVVQFQTQPDEVIWGGLGFVKRYSGDLLGLNGYDFAKEIGKFGGVFCTSRC